MSCASSSDSPLESPKFRRACELFLFRNLETTFNLRKAGAPAFTDCLPSLRRRWQTSASADSPREPRFCVTLPNSPHFALSLEDDAPALLEVGGGFNSLNNRLFNGIPRGLLSSRTPPVVLPRFFPELGPKNLSMEPDGFGFSVSGKNIFRQKRSSAQRARQKT